MSLAGSDTELQTCFRTGCADALRTLLTRRGDGCCPHADKNISHRGPNSVVVSIALAQDIFWQALGYRDISIAQLEVLVIEHHVSLQDHSTWTPCIKALTFLPAATVAWLWDHELWFSSATKALALKLMVRHRHDSILHRVLNIQKVDIGADVWMEVLSEAVHQKHMDAYGLIVQSVLGKEGADEVAAPAKAVVAVTTSALNAQQPYAPEVERILLTSLGMAAEGGCKNMVVWLCRTFPKLDPFGRRAYALRWAAFYAHVPVVDCLLQRARRHSVSRELLQDVCEALARRLVLQPPRDLEQAKKYSCIQHRLRRHIELQQQRQQFSDVQHDREWRNHGITRRRRRPSGSAAAESHSDEDDSENSFSDDPDANHPHPPAHQAAC